MAGYQTIEAMRPILHRGPVATPIVDRALVQPLAPVKPKRKVGDLISQEVIDQIVAMRRDGSSYRLIQLALKVSPGSIREHTRDIPAPEGGWPHGWANGTRKVIVRNKSFAERLRRAGFTYAEIGEEIDCCGSEVIRLLKGARKRKRKRSAVSEMLRRVASATGFTREQLRKPEFGQGCREINLAKARHIAFWLIRSYRPELSLPVIGNSLGGYDHTTVLHGFRRTDKIAQALALTTVMKPQTVARMLWAADWRKVGK